MPETGLNPDGAAGRAVYGLRVSGLDEITELDGPADQGDDLIPVHVCQAELPAPQLQGIDGERTIRELPDNRQLHLERTTGRATFFGAALPPDELAHPYLGPVAITFNRWAGREVFHAAAFVVDGRAFVILGARTAGKSTLVAGLAGRRIPILADDIVVIDHSTVYAGPRSVDLRDPLPDSLPDNQLPAARPSRLGTRTRIGLPPMPLRWPLGGWIFLHWHDGAPSIRPVPLPELLGRLAGCRLLPGLPSDPTRILALCSAPAWDFNRNKSWDEFARSVETLLAAVDLSSSLPEPPRSPEFR